MASKLSLPSRTSLASCLPCLPGDAVVSYFPLELRLHPTSRVAPGRWRLATYFAATGLSLASTGARFVVPVFSWKGRPSKSSQVEFCLLPLLHQHYASGSKQQTEPFLGFLVPNLIWAVMFPQDGPKSNQWGCFIWSLGLPYHTNVSDRPKSSKAMSIPSCSCVGLLGEGGETTPIFNLPS